MDEGDSLIWQLLLQIFLIILNAVFACTEIAVISINDKKLEKMAKEGDKRAIKLDTLLEQPSRFLSVIQVGITMAGFLGSAFAADNFASKLAELAISMGIQLSYKTINTICVVIVTLILSYFTLIFGELLPKRIAMRNAERVGLAMSGFIYTISKVFAPIVWFLTASTNVLLRCLRIDPNADDEQVTEEEIRLMVDAGSEKGAIDHDEREFIHNLFDFDDMTAEEIMTHRTDVSILWLDQGIDQWEQTMIESLHTIYPVCNKDVDDVIGILNIKDYFRMSEKSHENILSSCIKPAYFVPETVRADILFRNMKTARSHFAIVMDEYGGMSGIITINDLLEELVGDLEDDASIPEDLPQIERKDSGKWLIRGGAPLDEVSDELGIKLPDAHYDTFGGFVFDLLGTIPEDGSTLELEAHGLFIKITEIREHRLETSIVSYAKKGKLFTDEE